MQKRRLGNTAIEVSVIGLGTVKFGRNEGVKYPKAFLLPSDQEIDGLLNTAAEWGVNLLDTAPAYGVSEERLGKALCGKRHQWVISTKAGEEFINGISRFDFRAQAIRNSVERSLKRLGTDYLDVVLVHSDGDDERIIHEDKVFETLERLKQEGKLRAFGMSSKTVQGGIQAVNFSDVVMVAYHQNYIDEQAVINHAQQNNKGVFIKKAFASGHLNAEEALRFVLAKSGVTSVIIGTINKAHLKENIASMQY